MDTEVFAFTLLVMSLSLLAGKFLRLNIPLLRKLFLPSSVIGGWSFFWQGPRPWGCLFCGTCLPYGKPWEYSPPT